MTGRAPSRHAFRAAAALAALAAFAPVPAAPAEMTCRANGDFRVEVNGADSPDARYFVADVPGKFLVDIPAESKSFLIDMAARKAVTVSRWNIKPGATADIVRLADPGASVATAYALTIEGPVVRFQADTLEVRLLKATEGPPIAAPTGNEALAADPKAMACLHLESRPVATGAAGCTKFVYLRNNCDAQIVAGIRRTEHLMSGTLPETFSVAVPPGAELPLGCAWWSGAMAPSGYDLLTAGFPVGPRGHKSGGKDRSTRH